MLKKHIPGHFWANDGWLLVIAATVTGLVTHSLVSATGMALVIVGAFISSQSRHLAQPDHKKTEPPTPLERLLWRNTALGVATGFIITAFGAFLTVAPPAQAALLLQEPLFVLALVFYTAAMMRHWATGYLDAGVLVLLGLGLATDSLGTLFVCTIKTGVWLWTTHSIAGLVAILIMAVHFVWAAAALWGNPTRKETFRRWSRLAWLIWLTAFTTGIPIGFWRRALVGVAIVLITVNATFIWRWNIKKRQEEHLL